MAKINVSTDGYYDIAVNAGTLSHLSEQVKANFCTLKNNTTIQSVINSCDLIEDLSVAEKRLQDIIVSSNKIYEVASYAYYVYSETAQEEKNIVSNATELSVENVDLVSDTSVHSKPENNKDLKDSASVLGALPRAFDMGSKLFGLLAKGVAQGLTFTEKGIYTIVSGAIRDIGCGTRYLTSTLENGSSSVCDIFNKTSKLSKISSAIAIGGDALSIVGTGINAYTKIYDIWDNDELTEREKKINTAGVSIASAIGAALDVAAIVCTCTGVAAPIGLALGLVVTSDSGIAATTAIVDDVVESCEQIENSVAKAYNTGQVDMAEIGDNFSNAVGDALQTGGDIITSAWDNLMDSDGVLDAIGNTVNLVCAPVAAAAEVVVNSVVAAGTAVVNTVASAGAAVINWFKKW